MLVRTMVRRMPSATNSLAFWTITSALIERTVSSWASSHAVMMYRASSSAFRLAWGQALARQASPVFKLRQAPKMPAVPVHAGTAQPPDRRVELLRVSDRRVGVDVAMQDERRGRIPPAARRN